MPQYSSFTQLLPYLIVFFLDIRSSYYGLVYGFELQDSIVVTATKESENI